MRKRTTAWIENLRAAHLMVCVIDNGNRSVLGQTFNYKNKNFAANWFLEQVLRSSGRKTFHSAKNCLYADKACVVFSNENNNNENK